MLDYTAIDFETANSYRGSPCAVGLVRVRDGVPVDARRRLMRPPELVDYFDPFNTWIHGISAEAVANEPRRNELLPLSGPRCVSCAPWFRARSLSRVPSIRNLAVGLPVRAGHVLVLDGTDSVKGQGFHRAIGGGIEFGETAELALRREFVEELAVTLRTVHLLGVIENIFEYEGAPGHEIVHVFGVESNEIDNVPFDVRLHVLDEGSPVGWVQIGAMDRPLYPDGVIDLLHAWARQRAST